MKAKYVLKHGGLEAEITTCVNKPCGLILRRNDSPEIVLDIHETIAVDILNDENRSMTLENFKYSRLTQTADGLSIHGECGTFAVDILYRLDISVPGIVKSLILCNRGDNPVTLVRIYTMRCSSSDSVSGGGTGLPVYLDGRVFAGVKHPYGKADINGKHAVLYHSPGVSLNPSGTYWACDTVIGIAGPESASEAFTDYMDRHAVCQEMHPFIYGDWALHDELGEEGYSIELTEDMTMQNLEFLGQLKHDYNIHFDYYLMDHGWYDPEGDYIKLKKPNWQSDKLDTVMGKLDAMETKLGLWFSVNSYFENDDNIKCGLMSSGLEDSRCDRDSAKGSYCLSSEPYYSALKNAMVHWAKKGVGMFKLDFMDLGCMHPSHCGLPMECRIEKDSNALLEIVAAVRKVNPKVVFVAFNGFVSSPWWLLYVDTLFVGDPQPCSFPSVRLRTSINMFNDRAVHRYIGYNMPRRLIDDCGTMVGSTTTIFYTGKEDWRSMALLSAGRGNAFLWYYGDYTLFDDADKRFMAGIFRTLEQYRESRDVTSSIGKPDGRDIYGYAHIKDRSGYVVIFNPLLVPVESVLKVKDKLLHSRLMPMEGQLLDFATGKVVLTSGAIDGFSHANEFGLKVDRAQDGNFEFKGVIRKELKGDRIVIYLQLFEHGEELTDKSLFEKLTSLLWINGVRAEILSVPSRFAWNGLSWMCITTKTMFEGEIEKKVDLELKTTGLPVDIQITATGYVTR